MVKTTDELYAAWVPKEMHEEIKRTMLNHGYGDNKSDFIRYALRETVKNLNRK